jgi:large exoprotein involved in heme utilization and adhesion
MNVVQGSDRMIATWNTFNIGSAARVNFAQPSASSVALNRVTSSDASQIMGQLNANGQVYLINPRASCSARARPSTSAAWWPVR